MKTIYLTYYAYLRDQCGSDREVYNTNANTLGALYRELQSKYGIDLSAENIKIAVNDHLSSSKQQLNHGDHVVFIPPVGGGQSKYERKIRKLCT